jgi:chorismate dehydratase
VSPSPLKKLRISVVQYLNTAPLVYSFTHGPLKGKYDLSFTLPSQCADDLRHGSADVAIIPAIEYQRIADLVVLPDLAIASKRRVRSLLIVAKKPMEEVRSIALDRSSRSTQVLTRILCAEHWRITPEFSEAALNTASMLDGADAAMVIGDPALRLAIAVANYATMGAAGELICNAEKVGIAFRGDLHVYDVVQEWRRMTGLPAVLAVWAAQRDALTPEMVADFVASKAYGLANLPAISRESSREEGWAVEDALSYLRENIDFGLDVENLAGLELYYGLAAKLGLTPAARAMEWAQADPISVARRA